MSQVLADGSYTYLYGNSRLAQYGASGADYFLTDALGSVRQVVDEDGAVILSKDYRPYGEALHSQGSGASSYGFAGEFTSSLTNLVYLRARWYAPQTGRFTQVDPSHLESNLYSYASSNPINRADPSGYLSTPGYIQPPIDCMSLPSGREVAECYQKMASEWLDTVNYLTPSQKEVVQDLLKVQWLAPFDTQGLEGDWLGLYWDWFFSKKSPDLGIWSTGPNGAPLVTITSPGFIHDLKGKHAYQVAKSSFKETYPTICDVLPGDQVNTQFTFTGKGSAGLEPLERYNALEWFMGSYDYYVTASYIRYNMGFVEAEMEVLNQSHWESGTRMPKSFIGKEIIPGVTIPPYLVPDKVGDYGPGASFWQKFVWTDMITY